MNRQRAGGEEGEGEGALKVHAKTSPRNSPPAWTRPRKSKKIFFGVGGHDQRGRCRRLLAPLPQRRAFVVLTVYEVRDLLAQVPDGAERPPTPADTSY